MMRIILTLAGVGALLVYVPKWTRPDLFFAVTVGTGFASTPQARRILHQYWLEVLVHTLIAWCIAGVVGMENHWALLAAVVWQATGAAWAIARAHRVTTQYAVAPSPVREAMLSPRPERMPGGWLFALGPLVFLGAAGLYSWVFWDHLPSRIAIHWGFQGADRWVERTPFNVFAFLALFTSLYGVMLLISIGLLRWSRTISVTGERARGEVLFRRGTILLLLGLQYALVIPAVVFAFRPATEATWVWVAVLLGVAAVAIAALARLGQGGSRIVDPAEYQPPIGDRTPDAAWKWGLIYYNPDDPALFVEKRVGLGYTFNFGNGWAWVLMAAILLPAILAIAL